MSDSNSYVPFFTNYYTILFFTATFLQFLLIYLITAKSPPTLDNLKCFLYNTCFTQLMLIFLSCLSQHRTLTNTDSLAVLVLGPSKRFGPKFSFSIYHCFLGSSMATGSAISITVLFRYLVLVKNSITQKHNYIMIACTYIAPFFVVITPFTDTWNFEKVQRTTRLEHPSYNLSIYDPFPGFADVTSFQFLFATLILTIGAYGIPLVCFFLTRKVLVLIRYHQNMSDKTKKQAQTLVRGLLLQSVLPCACYIPMFSSYIYTQTTGREVLISGIFLIISLLITYSEHLILATSAFPGFGDPFISFYFIVPYRIAILEFLRLKKKDDGNFVKVTINSTSGVQ